MGVFFLLIFLAMFIPGALIAWFINRPRLKRAAEERERGRLRAIEHVNRLRQQADAERERLKKQGLG